MSADRLHCTGEMAARPTPKKTSLFSDDWLARAQARVNADPELAVIGGWFTTAFSLTCGDRRAILRFDRGQLVDVLDRKSTRLNASHRL